MTITTSTYKISHSQYSGTIIKQWFKQYWMFVTLPVIIQFLLAVYCNITFLYTGFMTIFVIFPIIYMFVFYFYALAHESRYSTLPKHLEINEKSIIINYEPTSENQQIANTDSISISRITDTKHYNQQLLLMLDNCQYKFIIIPYSAFKDASHIKQIEELTKKLQ